MDDPTEELDEFLGLIRDSRVTTYAVRESSLPRSNDGCN